MARTLFGTDGIRGLANRPPMDPFTLLHLGRAVAHYFAARSPVPSIAVGMDTRISGGMLGAAFGAGIMSGGGRVLDLGTVTTPAVAYLTRRYQADAGAVVSASHNPFFDNGIKIFGHDGFKLPDEAELQIEQLLRESLAADPGSTPTGRDIGTIGMEREGRELYLSFLRSALPDDVSLVGMRVALDCANGAASRLAPELFLRVGADVRAINAAPDGTNINDHCGALHPENLAAIVRGGDAVLGIAFDGDADRAIFVDENGEVVDGDFIMAVLAARMKERGLLRGDTLVATVMSNLGLDRAMDDRGISVVKTQVGDRYVVEEMRRSNFNFGGEQSGHLVFLDYATTGDGLLAGLMVLTALAETGRPLSDLKRIMRRFPQVLINVEVGEKRPFDSLPRTADTVRRIEARLGSSGRVLLRYSGTENLARVMVEGPEKQMVRACAEEIAVSLKNETEG